MAYFFPLVSQIGQGVPRRSLGSYNPISFQCIVLMDIREDNHNPQVPGFGVDRGNNSFEDGNLGGFVK